jgi:hypothetical protein
MVVQILWIFSINESETLPGWSSPLNILNDHLITITKHDKIALPLQCK